MQLTEQEINDRIRQAILPIIRSSSPEVADLVRENIEQLRSGAAGRSDAVRHLVGTNSSPSTNERPSFGAYVRALAAGRNDKERAAKVAQSWGYHAVARAIEDSVSKAMSAGDPVGGGFLVPTEFSSEVIELLRASGVVRSLGPTTIPMSSGTFNMPRVAQGSTSNYIGENAIIPKSELKAGQLKLSFKKLATLVPVSNDLIRYASPSADQVVTRDITREMSKREDLAFLRGSGLDGEPKGLKNWIAASNKFNADAANTLTSVASDLGKAVQNLMDADITLIIQQGATGGVDVSPGWIMSPRVWRFLTTLTSGGTSNLFAFRDEMLRGTLLGWPYRVTTQVENDTFYFGAFAHVVIGEGLGLIVDASQEAAYHDGTNVVATFSQDQTVIRVIAEHDFALRHDKAFSLIENVTWGA